MKRETLILGIESSCDETAASVVRNGHEVLSNIVASQADIHQQFGGVVPEVASRYHVEVITAVIDKAMKKAHVCFSDLDGIAVCQGPGLVGSLIVGLQAAKAISFSHGIPLIPVHHIAGHIYANAFETTMQFPLIALVVSGGHTELILMTDHHEFEYLGRTLDDAVGEAYDKVARILDIGYPGGPLIDQLATTGFDTYHLPRIWLDKNRFDFSFSGLKSAVINLVHNAKQRGETIDAANLAASFQASVVEVLTEKTMRALEAYDVKHLVVAGGVAANSGLRSALTEATKARGINLSIPAFKYCTDNAAMIAAAGTVNFEQGNISDLGIDAKPNLKLS
ncbi:MAG: tRNA (adenosine(37)-N6)-threonylcarbamoyltransferase complex transferase subunit TsaD [Defluviitaleaceae bacterium]|nr:tRNA (adenosine(37)-N6)-threonylcarbamoyltransferase complex transferase subunit TsaD [Defluviitaleaceae bacterium]